MNSLFVHAFKQATTWISGADGLVHSDAGFDLRTKCIPTVVASFSLMYIVHNLWIFGICHDIPALFDLDSRDTFVLPITIVDSWPLSYVALVPPWQPRMQRCWWRISCTPSAWRQKLSHQRPAIQSSYCQEAKDTFNLDSNLASHHLVVRWMVLYGHLLQGLSTWGGQGKCLDFLPFNWGIDPLRHGIQCHDSIVAWTASIVRFAAYVRSHDFVWFYWLHPSTTGDVRSFSSYMLFILYIVV